MYRQNVDFINTARKSLQSCAPHTHTHTHTHKHTHTHTHMFTESVGLQRHDLISFQQHMQSIPQRFVSFNNFGILYIYIYIYIYIYMCVCVCVCVEKENYVCRNRHPVKAPFETVRFRLSS